MAENCSNCCRPNEVVERSKIPLQAADDTFFVEHFSKLINPLTIPLSEAIVSFVSIDSNAAAPTISVVLIAISAQLQHIKEPVKGRN